jgi:urease accessory protein
MPLHLVKSPLAAPDLKLFRVEIRGDRQKFAKRLWRGMAEDGVEFGFELEAPLKHDQTVWQTAEKRYVMVQEPEVVLEIDLQIAPSAAAAIGWAIGNLHLELSSEQTRLLTPDDSAARQLLDRIAVPYRPTVAIFQPGRFARGETPNHPTVQDLGLSHRH